jgi:hypothetical protein
MILTSGDGSLCFLNEVGSGVGPLTISTSVIGDGALRMVPHTNRLCLWWSSIGGAGGAGGVGDAGGAGGAGGADGGIGVGGSRDTH